MDIDHYPQSIRVFFACIGEWRRVEGELVIDDVRQDMQHRDRLTFTCPECGKQHESTWTL